MDKKVPGFSAEGKGTFFRSEVVFVDNHSSDQTVELLTAYEKKDDFSRFEIIQQEQNQGFGNANNLGASFGKDEIVCFLNV